jgi:hypothetical protein
MGIAYYPFIFRDADHLLAYSKSAVFKEMIDGYRAKTGIQILAYTYYGARHTTAQKAVHRLRRHEGPQDPRARRAAYRATPEACGANPTPIAFAEVYLALQNGTVDAQENPLTTIEAKKFYEVQKHIMLTGHIVDGLTTQVAPHVWNKLSDADKKIFTDVAQEAARAPPPDQEARGRAGRRVQEEGPGRDRQPPELRRRGAQGQVRVDGLRQARTTTDRGDQVVPPPAGLPPPMARVPFGARATLRTGVADPPAGGPPASSRIPGRGSRQQPSSWTSMHCPR